VGVDDPAAGDQHLGEDDRLLGVVGHLPGRHSCGDGVPGWRRLEPAEQRPVGLDDLVP